MTSAPPDLVTGHAGVRAHPRSHAELLTWVTAPPEPAALDAIIVPTVRDVSSLAAALDLARYLERPLIALCSHEADAARTVELGRRAGAQVFAADVGQVTGLPRFGTSDLLRRHHLDTPLDTSTKRNIGLSVAAMRGWERVLFLDDDVDLPERGDVTVAAGLLDESVDAVGLKNVGFEDNSVVCFGHRAVGGRQDSFIGGGALVVPSSYRSFFPAIYNDDWFFLLDALGRSRVHVYGSIEQREYDPFQDPGRAAAEEFGDCLAEGVYLTLHQGFHSGQQHDVGYWEDFLRVRRDFIDTIITKIPLAEGGPARQERIRRSMAAARAQSALVTAALCVDYLRELRDDRNRWWVHLDELPKLDSSEKALGYFGLRPRVS